MKTVGVTIFPARRGRGCAGEVRGLLVSYGVGLFLRFGSEVQEKSPLNSKDRKLMERLRNWNE